MIKTILGHVEGFSKSGRFGCYSWYHGGIFEIADGDNIISCTEDEIKELRDLLTEVINTEQED